MQYRCVISYYANCESLHYSIQYENDKKCYPLEYDNANRNKIYVTERALKCCHLIISKNNNINNSY